MKWKSILAAGAGEPFSIRRETGNEFSATTVHCASVTRITARQRAQSEIGGRICNRTSQESSHDRPRRAKAHGPEPARMLRALCPVPGRAALFQRRADDEAG